MSVFLISWLAAMVIFWVGYKVGRAFGFDAGVEWHNKRIRDQYADRQKLDGG